MAGTRPLDPFGAERLGLDAVIVALAVDSGFKYSSVSLFADDVA